MVATAAQIAELNALAKRGEDAAAALAAAKANPNSPNAKLEAALNAGAPPGVTKGLNDEQKPFSMGRFLGSIKINQPDIARHEWDTADKYTKALRDTGCQLQNGEGDIGYWLPLNPNETYGGKLKSTKIGEDGLAYCKAVFDATKPQLDKDEFDWLIKNGKVYVKSQSAYDDAIGGSLVPPPTMGPTIPLIRPSAAFLAAGATSMTLPPSGRYTEPRILTPPGARAVGEGQTAPVSLLGTGFMELTAKKMAGAITLSEEGTAFSGGTIDAFAQSELGRSLGLLMDAYGFYGLGSTQIPAGLTSNTYAGKITNMETDYPNLLGIGPDGNQLLPQYGDIFPAIIGEKSFSMDGQTGKWIMRPGPYAIAMAQRASAVASGDQQGPMVDILRRFTEKGGDIFKGRDVIQSTNIDATATKGAGTALTDVFFGIWPYAVWATYGAIQFQQGHNGTTFLNGQVLVKGTMYGDIGFRYPGAFLWYQNVIGISSLPGAF